MGAADGTPRREGRPRRGEELTWSRLGEAAIEVVAAHGVEGLTRGAVAERAGVSARATYRLAPSTDDLISAAVTEWQRRWQPPPDTGDWVDDLIEWSEATLAHMRAHSGLVAASLRMRPTRLDEEGTPVMMAATRLLVQGAGVSPEVAGDACGVLSMHCLAWELTLDARMAQSADLDPEMVAQHEAFMKRGFRRGLTWILDGVRAEGETG
ncbi:MAG: helix-turn-helix domain-containing protein [Actinomycetota bacterium]